MRYFVTCLIVLTFVCAKADLIGLVSYPHSPNSAVVCSVRFDDNNKILAIDKIYSDGKQMERKLYVMNDVKYLLGRIVGFSYSCDWYDSILTTYFSLNDIMKPTVYDTAMSRTLSIFFSGSWVGENVTRKGSMLTSEYWQMDILAYNAASTNLSINTTVCPGKTN